MPPSSKGLRVVIVAGQLGLGGAERQLFHLARGLAHAAEEPLVVNLNGGAGDYWEDRMRSDGIEVATVARGQRLARIWSVFAAARRHRAEIIQGFHFFVNGYVAGAARLHGCPSIGAVRFLPTIERLRRTPFAPWRRFCLRGVDRIVCNSEAARRQLGTIDSAPADVSVVPNGVKLPPMDQTVRRRRELRDAWGMSDERIVLGFVGTLNPNKNLSLLLRALARIGNRSDVRLVVVGDGPSRPALERQVAALELSESVRFLGQQSFAERWMPAFDLVCQTSESEGMPNVLMEAAAAGVAVLATRVGGVAEVVRDGETGRLVPPGDELALAEALRSLVRNADARRELGRRGRARMEAKFSVDAMVGAYRELYHALARKSGGRAGAA